MKKIKIFIVTYNDAEILDMNLASLYASNFDGNTVETYVINNHSNFNMNPVYNDRVTILHNATRPDFSKGHLAKDWNSALINGFKDLNSPDCDIVVCCQDDTLWRLDTIQQLVNLHNQYSFYTCTLGDGFHSYTADAVRKIGLWDERFCGIAFQEADYYLRAAKYNKEASSINDAGHGRILNRTYDIVSRTTTTYREHNGRSYTWGYCVHLFKNKWQGMDPEYWPDVNNLPTSTFPTFILYPYFEKDIDKTDRNYFGH